jgi:translation initiation factor 4B
VQDVRVIRHQDTQKPKGAFITLADADGCARALSRNNAMLLGRPMRVDAAEARPERSSGGACCTTRLHVYVRAFVLAL